MAPAMAPYEPRAPRQTLLSPVVADPLETFLASLDAAPDASGLPAYVERECYDAAVAPASGSVSQPWWWKTVKRGRLSKQRAFAQSALRVLPGGREPL